MSHMSRPTAAPESVRRAAILRPRHDWTGPALSDKMSYTARVTVSVRELQQNLKRVMARVEAR
jgi:hypothetical protein